MAALPIYSLRMGQRLTLLGVVPKEGTLLTLRIVRDLQQKLGPSAEESARLKFETVGDNIKWDGEADRPVPIPIALSEREIILSAFKKLDESGKLELRQLDVYDLSVGEPPVAPPLALEA